MLKQFPVDTAAAYPASENHWQPEEILGKTFLRDGSRYHIKWILGKVPKGGGASFSIQKFILQILDFLLRAFSDAFQKNAIWFSENEGGGSKADRNFFRKFIWFGSVTRPLDQRDQYETCLNGHNASLMNCKIKIKCAIFKVHIYDIVFSILKTFCSSGVHLLIR